MFTSNNRWLKIALTFCMVIVLGFGLGATALPQKALAADCAADYRENYAPDVGAIKTNGPIDGDVYGVTLEFSMTDQQIKNLRCIAEYLELDFHLYDFNLSGSWSNYAIYTNLPGAWHDTPLFDGDEVVPGVTGIKTASLTTTRYYATLWWHAQKNVDTPKVLINFVPSYWASVIKNPAEWSFCQLMRNTPPYCIFGSASFLLSQTWFKEPLYGYMPFTGSASTWVAGSGSSDTSLPSASTATDPPPANWASTIPNNTAPSIPAAPATIKPTAISRNERTMDVFYKSENGNLVARGWDVDFGWNHQWWPDQLAGNPVAVARKPEAMDIFYRRSDGSLWNRGWDVNSGWAEPQRLVASGVVGDPAVVSRAPGSMDVFWRTSNNELKNVHWESATGWGQVVTRVGSGQVFSNPTVVARTPSSMDVFYVGGSATLKNIGWGADNGWGSPVTRCNSATGNPSAVSRNDGVMSVFYHQSNGDLAECWWDWTVGWNHQSWVAPMVGDPTVVARDSSHMDVFYRKSDGTLWNRWWDVNSGWDIQGWDDGLTSDPVAVRHSGTTMDVFFRDGGNSLINRGVGC